MFPIIGYLVFFGGGNRSTGGGEVYRLLSTCTCRLHAE